MAETKIFDVHVRNIGSTPSEQEIKKLFSTCGAVHEVRFLLDKETGKSKDYCFVGFSEEACADCAVKGLNGSSLGGQEIKVEKAKGPRDGSGAKCSNCQRTGHRARDCRAPGGVAYTGPQKYYGQSGYGGSHQPPGGFGYDYSSGGGPWTMEDHAYGPDGSYGPSGGYGPVDGPKHGPNYAPGGYAAPGGHGQGDFGPGSYGSGGYEEFFCQTQGGYGSRGGSRGGGRGGGKIFEARPGDWRCEKSIDDKHCGNLNFARRDSCNKCEQKK